jgi:hypothetical protein
MRVSTLSGDTDTFDPTQYEFDERPADTQLSWEVEETEKERVAVIRTSDRILFRRCRRKWGWNSHLRGNLGGREGVSPLWMGSGFHFALEDFHSHNLFEHPAKAFAEYVAATKRHNERGLPPSYMEDWELAEKMLTYYADSWLKTRDPYKTYVYNGVYQVEVNFRVDMTDLFTKEQLERWNVHRVVYSGTLDRVIEDEYGQLWIVEYKTAKAIQTLHLANDSQVSSYCWAGQHLYGKPIAGVIYQQHRKDIPHEPTILGSGRLSTNKQQLITYNSLRGYIKQLYGTVEHAPADYLELLNHYAKSESVWGDKFVLRTRIERNQHQCEAEGVKIKMETEEMLNPELALYPNPDRTCQFMCQFNSACVSLDDGSDWESELDMMFQQREANYDSWRKKIRWPGTYTDITNTLAPPSQQ